jgi:hypothetical protein
MDKNQKKLSKWFKNLPPEKRLAIALEIEKFRRGARFVDDKKRPRRK